MPTATSPFSRARRDRRAARPRPNSSPRIATLHHDTPGSYFFRSGTGQDAIDSSTIIVEVGAGGLGLPDRDYYLKTDPKSVKLRQQYTDYIAAAAHPHRRSADPGQGRRCRNLQHRDRARQGLAHPRRAPRSAQYLSHDGDCRASKSWPPPSTGPLYFKRAGRARRGQAQRLAARIHQGGRSRTHHRRCGRPARLSALPSAHRPPRPISPIPTSRPVRLLLDHPAWRAAMPPRWKTCTRAVDRNLGEALGQEFVRRTFTADTKAKTAVDDRADRNRDAARDREPRLDEPRHQAGGAAQAPRHPQQDRLSRQMARLHRARSQARRLLRQRPARLPLQAGRELEQARQARGSRRVGHDAADRQRLLRSADERHQLPRRRAAAAALRSQRSTTRPTTATPAPPSATSSRTPSTTRAASSTPRATCATGGRRKMRRASRAHRLRARRSTRATSSSTTSTSTPSSPAAKTWPTSAERCWPTWPGRSKPQASICQTSDGFTPDQRFFVGMAQWACSNERPEDLRVRAATDEHSPSFARINGVVSNLPEFQKAFACKAGQPMVHEPNCKVW